MLEKDAIDGLQPLSGSESTLDGFDVNNRDNQIKFSQEVDMEMLMTALHIKSQSDSLENNQLTHKDKPSRKPQSKHKPTTPNRTKSRPNTSQGQTQAPLPVPTQTPTSPRGQIKIRSITLKRHKENSHNYYCSTCNDNMPYKGVQALNNHH